MAWGTLEDLSGSVDLVFFPAKEGGGSVQVDGKWQKAGPRPGFSDWETLLKGDEPLLIHGSVQISNRDDDNAKAELIVESVESLIAVRNKRAKELEIELNAPDVDESKIIALRDLLEKRPGKLGVSVRVNVPMQGCVSLQLPEALRVSADDDLVREINGLFGAKVAEIG